MSFLCHIMVIWTKSCFKRKNW